MLRGYLIPLLEDNALYHERDISHSSVERVALVDMIELFDYMLKRTARIVDRLRVFPDNMLKNMKLSNNSIFSQRVLNCLVEKGMSREEAYDLIQPLAMRAAAGLTDFKEDISKSKIIEKLLSKKEISILFDTSYYFKNVRAIYERVGLIK